MSVAASTAGESVSQCRTCPWLVGADVARIPGYCRDRHERLEALTIAVPGELQAKAAMACHYAGDGEKLPCAGWLHHQLGVGNNIPLRLAVLLGRMPRPMLAGEQHQTFSDTLAARPGRQGRS